MTIQLISDVLNRDALIHRLSRYFIHPLGELTVSSSIHKFEIKGMQLKTNIVKITII